MGNIPRLQSGAQVAAVSSLLLYFLLLLGNRSKGQLCPGAARQMLGLMPWGARGRGEDPTRPLQLVAEIEASTPCRCSIWERSPGPWTHNQWGRNKPRGRAGLCSCVGTSARESGRTGGQVVSHSPASHIPSASLGSNHTPHTEETQSTDSGFLDTPVASKNSQAMTKQIGIWTANNSRTSLLGRACASLCWVLLPLPSPVPETVSCC